MRRDLWTFTLADLALGIWVFMSPILMVFFRVPGAAWNFWIVGLAVIALAVARAWRDAGAWSSYATIVLGLWLALSPLFIRSYGDYVSPSLIVGNSVVAGLLIAASAVLSLWWTGAIGERRGPVFASASPEVTATDDDLPPQV